MKRLHSLEPAEVSLVTRGANKRKFLIFKSMEKQMLDLIKNADPKAMAAVEKVLKEYCGTTKSTGLAGAAQNPANEQAAPGAATVGPSERAMAALKAAARILTPFKGELEGELLQKVMQAAGMEMSPAAPAPRAEGGNMETNKGMSSQSPEPIKEEHTVEALKAADEAFKQALAKLGYQKYPEGKLQMKAAEPKIAPEGKDKADIEKADKSKQGDPKVSEQILKADGSLNLEAVPAEMRAVAEVIFKGQQELVKKNAELTKNLADRDAADAKREVIAKADSYTHVGLPREEIIATLEDARKLGTESYVRICKQFDTLNTQGKSSNIFKEFGSNLEGKSNGAGSWEAIEKAAQAYVAKSGEKVSKEQAVTNFLETAEGQRMYREHQASRPEGV